MSVSLKKKTVETAVQTADDEIYPQAAQTVPRPAQEADPVPPPSTQPETAQPAYRGRTKFCKHCGQVIAEEAVICVHCGCQVEELKTSAAVQPIIINNNNVVGVPQGKMKNKWVAFFLCLFFGVLGVHRFYEGKIFTGILYLCSGGLATVGVFIDLIIILCKPNPYYV